MKTVPGYNDVMKRVYDHHQEHVFEYWHELDDEGKKRLLEDLSDVDFALLERLYSFQERTPDTNFEPAPFIPVPETADEMREHTRARKAGTDHAGRGKVAAFVVAGGQGSRLGFDGPKGKYPVGPVSGKTLFQIYAEKILKCSRKYKTSIPFLIMTSRANHDETATYFRDEGYFGLNPDDVYIFPQNMIPSLDAEGRLILETKSTLFKNPDGHGGSLTALRASGVLREMQHRGVETISYFQVDNPLLKIIDPVFIGFHVLRGADISSKAVKKMYPEEKVGLFVRRADNRIAVVEYSDLPEDMMRSVDGQGALRYSSANIAVHLFQRGFVEHITAGRELSLPFHTARKKIKGLVNSKKKEIEGYKFEKFVFDALPLTEKNIVFETVREEEFAPVKNAAGVDSAESAQKMMSNQFRSWLTARNIRIPSTTAVIEISPLVAVEPDDLDLDIEIPDKEAIYLS